jgi:cyclic lactone autoinducer peptide
MKKFAILATLVVTTAVLFTNTFASLFWSNQPKIPKALQK